MQRRQPTGVGRHTTPHRAHDSVSESVLLEASFYHARAEDVTDALMHKVMPRLSGKVGQVFTTERELQGLLQLLVANRQLLKQTCVKQAETGLNRGVRERP